VDWNWLYSSVAQSIASLAGVLGAFLISRVLSSEAGFARNRARTRELLRQGARLADSAKARDFEFYNRRSIEGGLEDIASHVRNGEGLLKPREFYDEYGFSPYVPRAEVLEQIANVVAEELEEKSRGAQDAFNFVPGLVNPAYRVAARQNLSVEREAISQLVVEVKDHVRQVDEHLAVVSAQPDRSLITRVALVSVVLMFLVGVVVPLSLLPVLTSTDVVPAPVYYYGLRAAVLGAATLVFLGLLSILAAMNERFVHPADELDSLRRQLDLSTYSLYLQVRVENGIPL